MALQNFKGRDKKLDEMSLKLYSHPIVLSVVMHKYFYSENCVFHDQLKIHSLNTTGPKQRMHALVGNTGTCSASYVEKRILDFTSAVDFRQGDMET